MKITNRRGEQRRDWTPNPRCHSAAWVCPASLIEKKLKDVGFFSPLLSVVTKKRKPVARRKALVPYLTLLLVNNEKYVRERKQNWQQMQPAMRGNQHRSWDKMRERKGGIGEDINCFQGKRRHGHSGPGCSLLH